MEMFLRKIVFTLLVAMMATSVNAQEKGKAQNYKLGLVGFYNLENLFDTVNDPNKNDEEFLPEGKNAWNTEKYTTKLHHMAYAISTIGTCDDDKIKSPDGLAVLGLSEMENRKVLEDLVAQPEIADRNYQIIHYDSPDRRGVDVALIYNPKYFKVTNVKKYRFVCPGQPNFISRDQLVVTGMFDDEEMSFIVMHWPSRYGGEKRSLPGRVAAANICRHITDSILSEKPDAKVIMMGDYNDYPTNKSIIEYLGAKGKVSEMQKGDYFNPMWKMHQNGEGTSYYRDVKGVLDQMIITPALLKDENDPFATYQMMKPMVHSKEFLKQHGGRYNGYPWRSFAGGVWLGGYSDHFPVYLVLLKKAE